MYYLLINWIMGKLNITFIKQDCKELDLIKKKEAIYKQKSCKIINVYKTICSNDNWHEDTAISNRSGCPPENSIKNIETPQEKDDETKQVRLIKENLEKWKNTLNQYQYRAEFSPWKATQWSKQN